jgi:hypothetical protein
LKYKLKIKGLKTPSGTISILALKDLVDTLVETAERGLRLAVQGESVKRGPVPGWLARSLDFTITGLKKGSTTLTLEAPVLGETAEEQIQQQDLWYSKPSPKDTAISLVSRSVKDAVAEDLQSYSFDKGILDGLLLFEIFFKSYGDKLEVTAQGRPFENFSLSCSELQQVRALKQDTPEPSTFVITGKFDLIQHSRRKFHLVLSNGQVIPGVINPEILDVENMREFWGKRVTIKGLVHFNPGRKVRLFEAQSIKLAESGEEIFERVPKAPEPQLLFDVESPKLSAAPALEEIWGRWPGEESIDELLTALTQ